MRRMFLVITLVAMCSTLSGCTPLAFAGGALLFTVIQQDIEKQEHTRNIERQRHERLRREAEEKARIEREQLACRQAEELRQRQHEEQVRRETEEKARFQREQLAIWQAEERRRRQRENAERRCEEQARWEAEEKVRIQREQLAIRRAEELRRRQAKRNREQLALLPDEADRHAASLADVRRELGEIVGEAIDIRKRLLEAKLNGLKSQPLGREQNHGNQ